MAVQVQPVVELGRAEHERRGEVHVHVQRTGAAEVEYAVAEHLSPHMQLAAGAQSLEHGVGNVADSQLECGAIVVTPSRQASKSAREGWQRC